MEWAPADFGAAVVWCVYSAGVQGRLWLFFADLCPGCVLLAVSVLGGLAMPLKFGMVFRIAGP